MKKFFIVTSLLLLTAVTACKPANPPVPAQKGDGSSNPGPATGGSNNAGKDGPSSEPNVK